MACSSSSGPSPAQGPGAGGGTLPASYALFVSYNTISDRNEPWIAPLDGTEPRSLAAGLPGGFSMDETGTRLSSDGRHLAAIVESGGIRQYVILDVATGAPSVLPFVDDASTLKSSFEFSPDSSRLILNRREAGSNRRRVFVMDADGSQLTEFDLGGDASAGWWSPTSTHFVCSVDPGGSLEKSFYLVGADGSVALDLMPAVGTDRGVFSPSWSADGSVLTYKTSVHLPGGEIDQVWAYTIAGGVTIPMSPAEDRTSAAGASASGSWVAYTALPLAVDRRLLYLSNVGSGAQVLASEVPASTTASISHVQWSPPGGSEERVAYLADHAVPSIVELHVTNTTGEHRRVHPPLADGQRVRDCWWSPDGRHIAFTIEHSNPFRRHLLVVDVDAGSPPIELTDPATLSAVGAINWSPNGQWLYATVFDPVTQRPSVRSFSTGDWANEHTLGEGGFGTIVESHDRIVSHILSPTSDSSGIVWVDQPPGQTESMVRYGRPGDPAATRSLSGPASAAAHGIVHQIFTR